MHRAIGHNGPKTVTFNADVQTEAGHRSARLGSRVIGVTLGISAELLTVVALLFNLDFASELAESWG